MNHPLPTPRRLLLSSPSAVASIARLMTARSTTPLPTEQMTVGKAAVERAAAAQADASAAQQQATRLLQDLLNELQARQNERGVLVTLGDVLFEFNRAEVKPTAQSSLRKLADDMQQNPARQVRIEGCIAANDQPVRARR